MGENCALLKIKVDTIVFCNDGLLAREGSKREASSGCYGHSIGQDFLGSQFFEDFKERVWRIRSQVPEQQDLKGHAPAWSWSNSQA